LNTPFLSKLIVARDINEREKADSRICNFSTLPNRQVIY